MLFASTATAQTFETSADAYYELQPQFIEDGEYLNIYFNLKFEDTADDIYDLVHRVEIRWNGTIIYAVEHTGLSFENYGSAYTVSTFDERRFGADTFRSYILTSVAASTSASRSDTFTYNDSEDVVQQHVRIKRSDMKILETATTTSTFTLEGWYHDQGANGQSTDYAGNHVSKSYTVTPTEEDTNYDNELELDLIRESGFNKVIWNVSKGDDELFLTMWLVWIYIIIMVTRHGKKYLTYVTTQISSTTAQFYLEMTVLEVLLSLKEMDLPIIPPRQVVWQEDNPIP